VNIRKINGIQITNKRILYDNDDSENNFNTYYNIIKKYNSESDIYNDLLQTNICKDTSGFIINALSKKIFKDKDNPYSPEIYINDKLKLMMYAYDPNIYKDRFIQIIEINNTESDDNIEYYYPLDGIKFYETYEVVSYKVILKIK